MTCRMFVLVDTGVQSVLLLFILQVIDQYRMTPEMWEERITTSYAQHKGMLRYNNAAVYILSGKVCIRTALAFLVFLITQELPFSGFCCLCT